MNTMPSLPADILRSIHKYNNTYPTKGVFMLYTKYGEPEKYIDILEVAEFWIFAKIQYEDEERKILIELDNTSDEYEQLKGFYIEINNYKYYFNNHQIRRYPHFDVFVRMSNKYSTRSFSGSENDQFLIGDMEKFKRDGEIDSIDIKVYIDYTNNKSIHEYETARIAKLLMK